MYQQAQQAAGGQAGPGPDMSGMGGMGGAAGAAGAGPQPGAADDNVVDADFEVVDDDKQAE